MKSGKVVYKNKIFVNIFLYSAILFYLCFLLARYNEQMTYYEIDSYALPMISIQYRGSLLMDPNDLKIAQIDFPNLYDGINSYDDLRSSKLAVTTDGQWKSAYFPIYSMICIPMKLLLQYLHINQEMTFGVTNVFCMLLLYICILSSKKLSQIQKLIASLLLAACPSFLYVQLISAEMMIFSFVGIGVLKFFERKYKTGAVFITLAGWANPTVMAIGIVFIYDYYANVLANNKGRSLEDAVKEEILPSIKLGCCFLPSFLPFIFNRMVGCNNFSPAAAAKEGFAVYVKRVLSYLFDLNLGFFSFAPILLILCIILTIYAVYLKKFRAVSFMAAFLGTILAYSLMPHINCGMMYCARYVYWTYPILVIFAAVYGYECLKKKHLFVGANILAVLTSTWLLQYNTNTHYDYTRFNQITEWIFSKMSGLYNPLYSTYYSRNADIDGGYDWITPSVYYDKDGYARKILAVKDDAVELLNYYDGATDDMKWFRQQVASLKEDGSYISIPEKYQIRHIPGYELGEDMVFYEESEFTDSYVLQGISYQEDGFRWTEGKQMKILCKIDEPAKSIDGLIELASVHNEQQKVVVCINDTEVFSDIVKNGDNIKFEFQNVQNSRIIEIELYLPDAVSPYALGHSLDKRELALALKRIVLSGKERDGSRNLIDGKG